MVGDHFLEILKSRDEIMFTNHHTVVPILVATLTETTLSNAARNFCHYYCECIYFSLSPKATSLTWPPFLGKWGGLIRGGLLYMGQSEA